MLRLATPEDAPGVLAIYAPVVEHTAISFEEVPPSVEEMAGRIAGTVAKRPWLVCEIDGTIAGYAYAAAHRERAAYRWCVEPSAYVHEGYRRRGVAQVLYTALFAALQAQGFYNAYAGITLPNDASIALHRRMGFTPIGEYQCSGYKHGRWHSTSWWQRTLRAHDTAPEEPLSMDALRVLPDWADALAEGAALLRR